jgi:hypothetical protein
MHFLSDYQKQCLEFVRLRAAENLAMPQRLAECRSPADLLEVWSGYFQTAMNQYSDHAHAVTAAGTEAAETLVREAEIEVEEAADAATEAMRAVTAATTQEESSSAPLN